VGVGVHGSSQTTAGGGVIEDAGSAVARPVDALEPHGSLVLVVVMAPLVGDGFLLARPSSCTAWRGVAVRQPSQLHLRLDGDALGIKVPALRTAMGDVALPTATARGGLGSSGEVG
jgi:hypothetical protein